MNNLLTKINKDILNIGKDIVEPFEKIIDTTIYGHIIYLIDIQLLLIFNFCKQNVKCNSNYIERIVSILQDEEIITGGLMPKVIKKLKNKVNKFLKGKKPVNTKIASIKPKIESKAVTSIKPKIESKAVTSIKPKIESKAVTSIKIESQPTNLEFQFSNSSKLIINNFIDSLITVLIKILNSKSAAHYVLVGLNKKTDINVLKNIKTIEDIENKISNICDFLFTFKNKCFKNTLCKNKAPDFLKQVKIQEKINILCSKTIPVLPTINESNSKLKLLAEITDIYLTNSKKHNKELNENYTDLILILNLKQSILGTVNNNLSEINNKSKEINNKSKEINNKSDDVTEFNKINSNNSSKFDFNIIIYTILDALNNIKSTSNYHLNQIKNKLYSGNKVLIHKKIGKISQEINNINDWLCVICILLHNIPNIETKISDGLLSDYLNILTIQKALKKYYKKLDLVNIIKKNEIKKTVPKPHKYYGGSMNNENIYILINILFNPPKITQYK
jgi:hypothetical protein